MRRDPSCELVALDALSDDMFVMEVVTSCYDVIDVSPIVDISLNMVVVVGIYKRFEKLEVYR
jgi:hypothetical protein